MKNFLIITLLSLALTGFGQRAITDTIQGAETVSFETMQGASAISATCTQLGGTSDGTLTLYGSTDGSAWVFVNYLGGVLGVASPKASITGADLNQITIDSALVANWIPLTDKFPYYKLVGVGTSGDTTLVQINWGR